MIIKPLKNITLGLVMAVSLTACLNTENAVEQTSRGAAKSVVNAVVASKFPGVDAAPYTDCIIDNATTEEIFNLAKGAITGSPTEAAVSTVVTIASRPAATNCIAQNAIGPLGAILGAI